MKLSFTTLGCPEWDLETIIAKAGEYGFDAIDFRGLGGEMQIWQLPEFAESAETTAQRIPDAGLEVSCFSSSVRLFDPDRFDQHQQEVAAYARLCEVFGVHHIRVFGGGIGETERKRAVEAAAESLQQLARTAEDHGARILLETHDDWTSCHDVRAVLTHAGPCAAGVLWDVHHPYRTLGEQPEETLDTIGQWIENTHWKDSAPSADSTSGYSYCLMGEGNIPLRHISQLLRGSGYSGYYTLEWEKKWHPELADPEIAFPQFVNYMRALQ